MSDKVSTRPLTPADLPTIARLHATVFGPGRFARTAYRVRERKGAGAGTLTALCRAAFLGPRMIASLTFTPVAIGGAPGAMLLGPLAVDPDFAGQGYGRRLVSEALDIAKAQGVKLVLLIGDEPYYSRLGFKQVAPGQITFPGPVDPGRILVAELEPGAAAACRGPVVAS